MPAVWALSPHGQSYLVIGMHLVAPSRSKTSGPHRYRSPLQSHSCCKQLVKASSKRILNPQHAVSLEVCIGGLGKPLNRGPALNNIYIYRIFNPLAFPKSTILCRLCLYLRHTVYGIPTLGWLVFRGLSGAAPSYSAPSLTCRLQNKRNLSNKLVQ